MKVTHLYLIQIEKNHLYFLLKRSLYIENCPLNTKKYLVDKYLELYKLRNIGKVQTQFYKTRMTTSIISEAQKPWMDKQT